MFGRGTDFICFDKDVDAAGGVLVIQTFLSEDYSEEVQIKGRTAR
jgi:preprotein translocase subunit SecA